MSKGICMAALLLLIPLSAPALAQEGITESPGTIALEKASFFLNASDCVNATKSTIVAKAYFSDLLEYTLEKKGDSHEMDDETSSYIRGVGDSDKMFDEIQRYKIERRCKTVNFTYAMDEDEVDHAMNRLNSGAMNSTEIKQVFSGLYAKAVEAGNYSLAKEFYSISTYQPRITSEAQEAYSKASGYKDAGNFSLCAAFANKSLQAYKLAKSYGLAGDAMELRRQCMELGGFAQEEGQEEVEFDFKDDEKPEQEAETPAYSGDWLNDVYLFAGFAIPIILIYFYKKKKEDIDTDMQY